jgi:hypothetical protein
MNNRSTLTLLAEEIALAFQPLVAALESPATLRDFLEELGWDFTAAPTALNALKLPAENIYNLVNQSLDLNPDEIIALMTGINQLLDAIANLKTATDLANDFKTEFPRQLIDYLWVEYLLDNRPSWGNLLMALGIIRLEERPAVGTRLPYQRRIFATEAFKPLLSQPLPFLRQNYHWGESNFDGKRFLSSLADLLTAWDLEVYPEPLEDNLAARLNQGALRPAEALDSALNVVLFENSLSSADYNAGIRLFLSPETATRQAGVVILPYLKGLEELTLELAPNMLVTLLANLDLSGGVGAFVNPNQAITIRSGLGGSAEVAVQGKLGIRADYQPETEPITLLQSSDGSFFEFQGFSGVAELVMGSANQPEELYGDLELKKGRLTIAASEADGFLQAILPADGLQTAFELGIGLSSVKGLYFKGSGGLEVDRSASIHLGALEVTSLGLKAKPQGDRIPLQVSATVKTELGPLTATIEAIGFSADFSFPEQGGNLGIVNLDAGFKAPKGVAIALHSSIISGGGYLYFDAEQAQYSGIVQLKFQKFSLTATGLLTTRMPDGSRGYSLLIMLAAADFQSIELGLGFKLTGIGGLLGVNRTVAIDVLRSGLKNKTLDQVLFPADPLNNAGAIVSTLRSVFPAAPNQSVLGPIAQIAWGKSGLLTANLGILLEFPNPVRLVLLGQMKALFPNRENPLVRLNLDLLGVIDFDRGEAFVQATLYDSNLYAWAITGDAAFFLRWKGNPTFILSIGGFHPAYLAPPEVPALDRLTMMLSESRHVQLRMSWYLALTSNTLQHGASVDLKISASKFSLTGNLSYDALIQFDPFFFIVDFSAGVALKWDGRTLAAIQLNGTLSGPAPWHIQGKATFKTWIFSKSVSFSYTLGEEQALPPLPLVNPKPALLSALAEPANWQAVLPAGTESLVVFKQEVLAPEVVKLHPLGVVSVRQQVLPLNVPIEKFGNARTDQLASYQISAVSLGNVPQPIQTEQEYFAPGQFQDLSQGDQLNQPSFVALDAGVRTAIAQTITYGRDTHLRTGAITYELDLIPATPSHQDPVSLPQRPVTLTAQDLVRQAQQGASAQRRRHQPGIDRFTSPARYAADLAPVPQVIANRNDLRVATIPGGTGVPATGTSYYQAIQTLREYERQNPAQVGQFQVIPLIEAT